MKLTLNNNNNIHFTDQESDFIERVAEDYKLHIHDLVLLSVLSLNDESKSQANIDIHFDHLKSKKK